MLDSKKIEKFARYIHDSVPKVINDFKSDLDHKIGKILQNQINQLNFIDKDEFDIYIQILLETQQKIKKLEKKITILELILKNNVTENKKKL